MIIRIKKRNKTKKKSTDDIEKFTIKDAIEKIKNEAMTNVILLNHMPNLSIEDKLYMMYFWGTRNDIPTSITFE